MTEKAIHIPRASAGRWRIVHSESSTGWGGQETRILTEMLGFQKRGNPVWLVAPAASELHRRAQAAGIPVMAMTFSRGMFPANVLRLRRWLRRERVNVLNPHSSRDAWVAGLAGRLAGVRLIVRTRHFDVPIRNPWLSRHVYRGLSDHVLTTSPKVTQHLRQLFQLPEDRVSTVSTGIDLARFSPEGPKANLRMRGTDEGGPVVGMVSVIRLAKGHETLLRAVRLLRDRGRGIQCVIVGEGPSRARVESQVRELDLSASVTLFGHREDVPDVLRALDIMVIPSLHEGIPQVGLQALATMTPVIGSDVGGIPSIIRPGQTGRLIPPGDASALAEAILQAVDDRETTQRLTVNGRRLIEAEHSVEHMLDRLEEVYLRHDR